MNFLPDQYYLIEFRIKNGGCSCAHDGWRCTRPKNHRGPHVAVGFRNRKPVVMFKWHRKKGDSDAT